MDSLPSPMPPKSSGIVSPNTPSSRHLPDDLHRDVAVGAVPGLRVADHLAVGEFAHLLADRFERIVEAAGADRGIVARAHQFDQTGAPLCGVAAGDQAFDVCVDAGRNLRRRKPEVARPHQFALAHRNPADDLGEIFAERDAHEVFLDLAERAGARPSVRYRPRAGARPPHRWRARPAHGWRAARGRTDGCRACRPPPPARAPWPRRRRARHRARLSPRG